MERYTLQLLLVKEYEVSVWANNRLEAEDIADSIDPDDENCEYIDMYREVGTKTTDDVCEVLHELTLQEWEETPTGGNCHYLKAEISPNVYCYIVDPEAAQSPSSPSDTVEVVLVNRMNQDEETIYFGEFSHLLEGHLLMQRLDKARMLQAACTVCGRLQTECANDSAETTARVNAIHELMRQHPNNPQLQTDLAIVLDGYLTHVVSECNKESRA